MDFIMFPAECISCIMAFTSTKDACRFAAVSTAFCSAVDSDALWKSFLPPDYQVIISQSSSSSSSSSFFNSLSKKDLYFHLSNQPLLIGNGNSSFVIGEMEREEMLYDRSKRTRHYLWKFTRILDLEIST